MGGPRHFLDNIRSAGRTKARKETQKLAWKIFADKCARIIEDFCKNDKKGMTQYLLLMKSEVSLWTFKKYIPLMLEQYTQISYIRKTKRYKVTGLIFDI